MEPVVVVIELLIGLKCLTPNLVVAHARREILTSSFEGDGRNLRQNSADSVSTHAIKVDRSPEDQFKDKVSSLRETS